MTDAPEKIWAHAPTTFDEMDVWQTSETDGAIEYTRTDVTDARIKELEANVDLKADWIHRTMSGMGADAQKIKELETALLECREEIEGLHQDAAGASL
jgi:hypothetical protein